MHRNPLTSNQLAPSPPEAASRSKKNEKNHTKSFTVQHQASKLTPAHQKPLLNQPMKHKLSLLVGLASLAAIIGATAQTAVTDPVGYITHTINPAIGGKADTLIAPALVNKNEFAGTTAAAAAGTNTLTFAGGVPVGLSTGYYIEITAGPQEGWWSTIAAPTTATVVTITDTVPAAAAGNLNIVIRKHTTLNDFFGAGNSANLDSGTTLDDADEVQTLNPTTGAITGYFYASAVDTGDPATAGWYTGAGGAAGNVAIEPGVAVQVRHKLPTTLSLVSVGYVKVTKTQVDLVQGDNWVTPMRATGVTLANSGLNTGVITTGVDQGTSLDDADELQFLNADQSITAYFAASPDVGNGWFTGAGSDANAVNITEPIGVIVRRKVTSPAIWTVPAVTIN